MFHQKADKDHFAQHSGSIHFEPKKYKKSTSIQYIPISNFNHFVLNWLEMFLHFQLDVVTNYVNSTDQSLKIILASFWFKIGPLCLGERQYNSSCFCSALIKWYTRPSDLLICYLYKYFIFISSWDDTLILKVTYSFEL